MPYSSPLHTYTPLNPLKGEGASVSHAWSFHRAPEGQALLDWAPSWKPLFFWLRPREALVSVSFLGAPPASLQSLCIHFYQIRQQGIDLACTLEAENGKILMFHCLPVWKWNPLKRWVFTKDKRNVFLNCIATSYSCNYLYQVWNSLSASFIQSYIFTRLLFSQMAKLRCRLGLKYLHKLWQSPPTNKNRLKKKPTPKNCS